MFAPVPSGFAEWSSCAPGSSVTLRMAPSTLVTCTLLSVDRDRVRIDVLLRTDVPGGLPRDLRHPLDIPAAPPAPPDPAAVDETLEVGGRSIPCRRVERVDGPSITRTWTSDLVPGGLVRTEILTDGTPTGLIDLVRFERK